MIITAALSNDQRECKIPAPFTKQLNTHALGTVVEKTRKKLGRLKNARESRGSWGKHSNGLTGTCAVVGTCGQRNGL
jgi:hypothetical protein